MSDVTQLLSAIQQGHPQASEDLLPLVYNELRELAAARLAQEKPGQTLQATALVHEAYLRLVGPNNDRNWDGRGHFFAAAAEAMRRILVDRARRQRRLKHGGDCKRVELYDNVAASDGDQELLAIDEVLDELESVDSAAARVVKLRYFAGYTLDETASLLGLSQSTVQRRWNFARAWLYRRIPRSGREAK